jgi:hypothetical protein
LQYFEILFAQFNDFIFDLIFKIEEVIMSVIMISRGAHHRGKEVAEKISLMLGYECLSRDILLDASLKYDAPEVKLKKINGKSAEFF